MSKRAQEGFTLVELLVVVAIIAILAAIAIPTFSSYRADGYDAHAISGLANLARAEEVFFASNGRYTTDVAELPPYYPPTGVVLTVTDAGPQRFRATSHHPLGTRTFTWDSGAGGLQP
ncbi:MAG TPA: prepilin-type N-terminal cleavage/methylation domain-containing protein [Candidatus Binatia bacterium]